MEDPCRPWWRNCALQEDPEILAIDRMEGEIGPLPPTVSRVRELISGLELCHHKAERWVGNIVDAIGGGETEKGLGTRPPGQRHPIEDVWDDVCAALTAWSEGGLGAAKGLVIDGVPASGFVSCLGERTPLRRWQVLRVIEKVRSTIAWARPHEEGGAEYAWLLLNGGEYEASYSDACPEPYREQEEFWLTTVRTAIRDTENGDRAALSLGLAIDMLMPCHWRFLANLGIVLGAIGGDLTPIEPFAACGRNISLLPNRTRMEVVCNTLTAFYGGSVAAGATDEQLSEVLGPPTAVKQWLAASLDKTIRLQLDPPHDVRRVSALGGPGWIWETPRDPR